MRDNIWDTETDDDGDDRALAPPCERCQGYMEFVIGGSGELLLECWRCQIVRPDPTAAEARQRTISQAPPRSTPRTPVFLSTPDELEGSSAAHRIAQAVGQHLASTRVSSIMAALGTSDDPQSTTDRVPPTTPTAAEEVDPVPATPREEQGREPVRADLLPFATRLTDLFQESGLTVYRLAGLVGRSHTGVRNWMQGRAYPAEAGVRQRLLQALHLDGDAGLFDSLPAAVPGPTRYEPAPGTAAYDTMMASIEEVRAGGPAPDATRPRQRKRTGTSAPAIAPEYGSCGPAGLAPDILPTHTPDVPVSDTPGTAPLVLVDEAALALPADPATTAAPSSASSRYPSGLDVRLGDGVRLEGVHRRSDGSMQMTIVASPGRLRLIAELLAEPWH